MSDTLINETSTIAEIVQHAQEKWEALTGISSNRTSFKLGDLDAVSMARNLEEANKLDPEGTTAYFLLECFLRYHLEQKTFTAATIMKDYAATSAYLKQAEELFSIVQSDRAHELASAFRARVMAGIAHYGADRDDVIEMVNDPDALPFLRRDALHSLHNLKPYQFLSGEHDTGPAQVIEHVYQTWDINHLLRSLRDMPVNGIAVVLIRDPSNPERSYFAYTMRNGGNVIVFTDKTKPAYPGQEDTSRSRGANRAFVARAWSNHFPYQLIKTTTDENGDLHFTKETAPVASGLDVVPLMKIKDLPAGQIIWITMMLSLISDKFWRNKWQAEALSYTGDMVRNKTLLVTDESGANLPVAKGYQPIALEDIKIEDISKERLDDQFDQKSRGINNWLEQRYKHLAPAAVYNQWFKDASTALVLVHSKSTQEALVGMDPSFSAPAVSDDILTIKDIDKIHHWKLPAHYKLKTFSPTDFGTSEELNKDRLWIARYNLSEYVQKSANEEFYERKKEVADWYFKAVKKNLPELLTIIGRHRNEYADKKAPWHTRMINVHPVDSKEWEYTYSYGNNLSDYSVLKRGYECVLTEAIASFRALLNPDTSEDLALLAGCKVSELPDVLQHWSKKRDNSGNHLLNRLDPMDYNVEDPWLKLQFDVNIYLSKRGMTQVEKRARVI